MKVIIHFYCVASNEHKVDELYDNMLLNKNFKDVGISKYFGDDEDDEEQ